MFSFYPEFCIEQQGPYCWHHLCKLWGLLDSSAVSILPFGWGCLAYCPRVVIISFPPFAQKAVGSNQGSIQTVCFNPASLHSTSFIGRTVGDSYYLPSPPLGQEHSLPDSRESSLIPKPSPSWPLSFLLRKAMTQHPMLVTKTVRVWGFIFMLLAN